MYIREVKTHNKGKTYIVHRLVEAYRTSDNLPRQRVIMHLGTLDIPRNRWKELAFLLEQRYRGQQSLISLSPELEQLATDLYARAQFAQTKPQAEAKAREDRDLVCVDLNSVRVSQTRSLGPELVVDKLWQELDLTDILRQNGLTERQISIAQALVFGKLIEPGSELATWRWFSEKTALTEMTPEDIVGLGKDSYYELGDVLYRHKESIEQALYHHETSLFGLDRRLFLFDLTNTYFEGNCLHNELAHRGKSKKSRSDSPLVSLALLVDNQGFPVYSQILKGNQSEPGTLAAVLADLHSKTGGMLADRKPVLIMDRGIATSRNLELIRESGYSYTVIERAPTEKEYVAEYAELKALLEPASDALTLAAAGWLQIREDLTVYARVVQAADRTRVLVFSLRKEAKELAMDQLKEGRLLADLTKLQSSVRKGNILVAAKISERIGKIRQKYPGICSIYEIEIVLDETGQQARDITWTKQERGEQRPVLAGCYVIETDRRNLTASEIWQDYITLTRVESAFRDLKSELGLRPVFHQTAARTQAHLFISVLAYHLLVGIESKLKRQGEHREWKSIRSVLATHQRMTVSLTSQDNELIQIRLSGMPESSHLEIYRLLGVTDRLRRKKSVAGQRK